MSHAILARCQRLYRLFERYVSGRRAEKELRSLDFDESAAAAYGRLRSSLEAGGTPVGPNDMLIAAQAISADLILVTANEREFSRIEGLRIENWRLPAEDI